MKLRTLAALILALGVAASCLASPRVMVVYNREGGSFPGRDLSMYDVDARRYSGEDVDSLAHDLAEAQLLYIGQVAGGEADTNIFAVPERAAAVKDLLARGGVLIFDYNGFSRYGAGKFLESLGLTLPAKVEGEYFDGQLAPGVEHRLLAEPHKISGDVPGGYAWWPEWSDDFTCLMCKRDNPDKALTLVADQVAGKGTVILTRAYNIFRDEERPKTAKLLFENMLTLAFGPLPGPGEAIPVFDPSCRRWWVSPSAWRAAVRRSASPCVPPRTGRCVPSRTAAMSFLARRAMRARASSRFWWRWTCRPGSSGWCICTSAAGRARPKRQCWRWSRRRTAFACTMICCG
jgi:hypothetical protein